MKALKNFIPFTWWRKSLLWKLIIIQENVKKSVINN